MYGIAGEATVAIEASRSEGPPGVRITGWSCKHIPDALRAAGRPLEHAMSVQVEPAVNGPVPTLQLPVALAVLIAHDRRPDLRLDGLVAAGALHPDGSLRPALAHPALQLPAEPWVGRFWTPTSEPPRRTDETLLTVFEVATLAQAWDVLERLPELDRGVRALGP